jgi:hypothetical protein
MLPSRINKPKPSTKNKQTSKQTYKLKQGNKQTKQKANKTKQ